MSTEQTALRFIRGPQARNSDQMAVISHLIGIQALLQCIFLPQHHDDEVGGARFLGRIAQKPCT